MKHKTIKWIPHQVLYDIKLGVILAGLLATTSAANVAYVPKTGPGVAGAGDNVGKQWPTTRFITDASGNCIIDNLTGLMWVKDGSLLGTGTWGDASTPGTAQYKVAQMNTNSSATGYHLCNYSDWRLPNPKELLSLFNYAASGGNQANWLNTQGFTNMQADPYWSSLHLSSANGAWYVNLTGGFSGREYDEGSLNFVWAVRGGK